MTIATPNGSGLRDAVTSSSFQIGASGILPSLFVGTPYSQTLGREFGLVTGVSSFWSTEPNPHQFWFCDPDQLLIYAQLNGQQVKEHALIWGHNDSTQLPAWLTGGDFSPSETSALLEENIATVVTHYRGQLVAWDVVNEALSDAPPYSLWPGNYWISQLGDAYIDTAFQWAHAADPNAKLFYNDYGAEDLGGKSDAVYNMVKGMLQRGVPIDGVGLEAHFTLNPPSTQDIAANIARLGALGLDVYITEMDVRLPVDANGNPQASDLSKQAQIFQNVLSACLANANCKSFSTYDVGDADSWIPAQFPGYGAATLFDYQYQPKPAYGSVKSVLQSLPARPPVISAVVNAEGGSTVLAPNTWVTLSGTALAPAGDSRSWQGSDFVNGQMPTALDGVNVSVNGERAYVYYISPGQINVLTPPDLVPGPVQVAVTISGMISLAFAAEAQATSPSFFVIGAGPYVLATHADGSLIGPATLYPGAATPAAAGESIILYANGFGPVSPPVVAGSVVQSGSLPQLPAIQIGGVAASVQFAGLVSPGLFQFNLTVPGSAGSGDDTLTAQYAGGTTQPGVLLSVGASNK